MTTRITKLSTVSHTRNATEYTYVYCQEKLFKEYVIIDISVLLQEHTMTKSLSYVKRPCGGKTRVGGS